MAKFFGALVLSSALLVGSGCSPKAALKPTATQVGHRCTCGCDKTGQCTCPSCNVGCGFDSTCDDCQGK